jgi:hypothetical protein
MAAARRWIPEDRPEDGADGGDEGRPWCTSGGETLLQTPDAPVYAALADQWRSAGRIVPGQADTEWSELVGRIPGLTGV